MDFEATQVIDLESDVEESEEESESRKVAELKVFRYQGRDECYYPVYSGKNLIGRDKRCNICIPVQAISKKHACIETSSGQFLVYDFASRNKTRKGKAGVRYELKDSDEISFADVKCQFQKMRKAPNDTVSLSGSETGSESMIPDDLMDDIEHGGANQSVISQTNLLLPTQNYLNMVDNPESTATEADQDVPMPPAENCTFAADTDSDTDLDDKDVRCIAHTPETDEEPEEFIIKQTPGYLLKDPGAMCISESDCDSTPTPSAKSNHSNSVKDDSYAQMAPTVVYSPAKENSSEGTPRQNEFKHPTSAGPEKNAEAEVSGTVILPTEILLESDDEAADLSKVDISLLSPAVVSGSMQQSASTEGSLYKNVLKRGTGEDVKTKLHFSQNESVDTEAVRSEGCNAIGRVNENKVDPYNSCEIEATQVYGADCMAIDEARDVLDTSAKHESSDPVVGEDSGSVGGTATIGISQGFDVQDTCAISSTLDINFKIDTSETVQIPDNATITNSTEDVDMPSLTDTEELPGASATSSATEVADTLAVSDTAEIPYADTKEDVDETNVIVDRHQFDMSEKETCESENMNMVSISATVEGPGTTCITAEFADTLAISDTAEEAEAEDQIPSTLDKDIKVQHGFATDHQNENATNARYAIDSLTEATQVYSFDTDSITLALDRSTENEDDDRVADDLPACPPPAEEDDSIKEKCERKKHRSGKHEVRFLEATQVYSIAYAEDEGKAGENGSQASEEDSDAQGRGTSTSQNTLDANIDDNGCLSTVVVDDKCNLDIEATQAYDIDLEEASDMICDSHPDEIEETQAYSLDSDVAVQSNRQGSELNDIIDTDATQAYSLDSEEIGMFEFDKKYDRDPPFQENTQAYGTDDDGEPTQAYSVSPDESERHSCNAEKSQISDYNRDPAEGNKGEGFSDRKSLPSRHVGDGTRNSSATKFNVLDASIGKVYEEDVRNTDFEMKNQVDNSRQVMCNTEDTTLDSSLSLQDGTACSGMSKPVKCKQDVVSATATGMVDSDDNDQMREKADLQSSERHMKETASAETSFKSRDLAINDAATKDHEDHTGHGQGKANVGSGTTFEVPPIMTDDQSDRDALIEERTTRKGRNRSKPTRTEGDKGGTDERKSEVKTENARVVGKSNPLSKRSNRKRNLKSIDATIEDDRDNSDSDNKALRGIISETDTEECQKQLDSVQKDENNTEVQRVTEREEKLGGRKTRKNSRKSQSEKGTSKTDTEDVYSFTDDSKNTVKEAPTISNVKIDLNAIDDPNDCDRLKSSSTSGVLSKRGKRKATKSVDTLVSSENLASEKANISASCATKSSTDEIAPGHNKPIETTISSEDTSADVTGGRNRRSSRQTRMHKYSKDVVETSENTVTAKAKRKRHERSNKDSECDRSSDNDDSINDLQGIEKTKQSSISRGRNKKGAPKKQTVLDSFVTTNTEETTSVCQDDSLEVTQPITDQPPDNVADETERTKIENRNKEQKAIQQTTVSGGDTNIDVNDAKDRRSSRRTRIHKDSESINETSENTVTVETKRNRLRKSNKDSDCDRSSEIDKSIDDPQESEKTKQSSISRGRNKKKAAKKQTLLDTSETTNTEEDDSLETTQPIRDQPTDNVADETETTKNENMNEEQKTECFATPKRVTSRKRGRVSSHQKSENEEEESTTGSTRKKPRITSQTMKEEVKETERKSSKGRQSLERSPSIPRSPGLRGGSIRAPKVLFTGLTDQQAEKVAKDLGADLVSSVYEATHLVTDKVRRTVKFLCCLSKGLPIVDTAWLDSCKQAGTFLPPSKYIVEDKAVEKQYKFSLKRSIEKAASSSLLAGYEVYVCKYVKPEPKQMKDIIQCAGGKVLARFPVSSDNDKLLVIASEEDEKDIAGATEAGLSVYKSELLLTGILQQDLNFKEYKIVPQNSKQSEPMKKQSTSTRRKRK